MRTKEVSDQTYNKPNQARTGLSASRIEKLQAGRAKARAEGKTRKKALKVQFSPKKAIRHFCLDCCGNIRETVQYCGATDCALWFYRLGHRPTAGDEMFVKDNFIEGGKFWKEVCGDE